MQMIGNRQRIRVGINNKAAKKYVFCFAVMLKMIVLLDGKRNAQQRKQQHYNFDSVERCLFPQSTIEYRPSNTQAHTHTHTH